MSEEQERTEAEAQQQEEEIRDQLEEEIRKVRMEDLVLQSAVSMLNLAARRIGKEDERDLEQARIGIDAAEALLPQTPEEARPQLEQAVSELKLAFAKASDSGSDPADSGDDGGETSPPGDEAPGDEKGDSGLWTPGSSKP